MTTSAVVIMFSGYGGDEFIIVLTEASETKRYVPQNVFAVGWRKPN